MKLLIKLIWVIQQRKIIKNSINWLLKSIPKEKELRVKANKNVLLTTLKEFNSVKIGDSCILCFTSLSKRPFSVYPCTMYELSDELKEKCVESLADVLKK